MQDIAPIIAPTQPGSTPGTSPSPTGGSDDAPFSSYLNEATATEQAETPTQNSQNTAQTGQSGVENEGTAQTDSDATASSGFVVGANTTPSESTPQQTAVNLQATLEQYAFTRVVLTGSQQGAAQSEALPEYLIIRNPMSGESPISSAGVGKQTIITAELEQLINLHEKGVVTITRQNGSQVTLADLQNMKGVVQVANGTPVSAGTNGAIAVSAEMQADMVAQATEVSTKTALTRTVVAEELPAVVRNNDQQTTHLRQDTRGQYLEAKIESSTNSGNSSSNTAGQQNNSQTGQQESASIANQATTGAQNSQTTTLSDTSQSYSQVSQGVLDTPTAKVAGTMPSAAPFPGSTVSDEAIVQQVANRFNMQVRNQETQINIRLHPAELGELKIDLTYRDGAIRANVFAQSQYVQEILEKNMPRLREVLQSHGVQVEEIQVSAKADIAESFDMLQEQFGNGGKYEQPEQRFQPNTFVEVLESATTLDEAGQEGVNVTV